MNASIQIRLSVMMFIQFFVWGAWYVAGPGFLGTIGFSGTDIGWTYSVGPIAGMISPFFVGMIADRFFSTERVLGVMHLAGAAAMFFATQMMQAEQINPTAINFMLFVHMLCYFPTLALVNSLSMQNLSNVEKQFPMIRVFGTIGWIIAGAAITGLSFSVWAGYWDWSLSFNQFHLATGAGLLLGLYSFTLPHTPPPAKGKQVSAKDVLGLDALVLLKNPSYLVFLISSFLICIPLAFYYQLAFRTLEQANVSNAAFKMSFGQMSEIIFMVLMPFFFVRLGVKWMLAVGMLAWVARYVLFAIGAPDDIAWMLIFGVVLHGICYDFFFVTGQIYTDKCAPPAIRGQAQGLLVLFTLGLGMFIGAQVAGRVEAHYTPEETTALLAQAGEVGKKIEALDRTAPGAAEQLKTLQAEQRRLSSEGLSLMNWKMIWGIPAAMAAVVLAVFIAVFKDGNGKEGAGVPAPLAPAPDAGEARAVVQERN